MWGRDSSATLGMTWVTVWGNDIGLVMVGKGRDSGTGVLGWWEGWMEYRCGYGGGPGQELLAAPAGGF